jgi:CheY-like chemotaxis protein
MREKRVLIYDDVIKEVATVAESLRDAGIKVDLAQRFAKARELVLGSRYDVVVFDLRLDNERDLDGLQFLTAVYDSRGSARYVIYSRWVDQYQDAVDRVLSEGKVSRCFFKGQGRELVRYLCALMGLAPETGGRGPATRRRGAARRGHGPAGQAAGAANMNPGEGSMRGGEGIKCAARRC